MHVAHLLKVLLSMGAGGGSSWTAAAAAARFLGSAIAQHQFNRCSSSLTFFRHARRSLALTDEVEEEEDRGRSSRDKND